MIPLDIFSHFSNGLPLSTLRLVCKNWKKNTDMTVKELTLDLWRLKRSDISASQAISTAEKNFKLISKIRFF